MNPASARWFEPAAERCCKSVDRLLSDIPYSVSRIQQLTEAPQKKTPKLSVLVDELNKLSDLYQNSPYYIIALEPNPAATDESVTHPHVSNERLCEGDAYTAIRSALQEGRLCDFFTMARSILNTYNPDSPYVSLYDWDSEPC